MQIHFSKNDANDKWGADFMGKEALIIVDMSNDFVAPDGSLTVGQPGQAIVPYIKSLAEDFVSQGKDVVVAIDRKSVV